MHRVFFLSRLVWFVVVLLLLLAACGITKQPAQAPTSSPPPHPQTTSQEPAHGTTNDSVTTEQTHAIQTDSETSEEPAVAPASPMGNSGNSDVGAGTDDGGDSTQPQDKLFLEDEDTPAEEREGEPDSYAKDAPSAYPSVASAPVRPRPQGVPAPLKAGERDDNAQFEEYLAYLAAYQDEPAQVVDVSERYIITVLDSNQRPVLDATVRIFDDNASSNEPLFVSRTYAGGKTLFLPHARGVSANTTAFRIEAEKTGQSIVEYYARGARERVELVLKGEISTTELRLDLLFLLDTTGSMGDELARIQETIDSIAQRIDSFTPRPIVRFGLVAYRDRGDAYVTQVSNFTADVTTFRQTLNSLSADGGGDTPESLNEGLHEAIQGVAWSDDAVRIVFLVADAGPHLDYADDYDYLAETQQAVTKGIKIYPIAASNTEGFAEYVFRQLAQQTLARFLFLTYQAGQSGGAPGENTTLQSGEQPYTVERLDDLIVQIVEQELAAVKGIG